MLDRRATFRCASTHSDLPQVERNLADERMCRRCQTGPVIQVGGQRALAGVRASWLPGILAPTFLMARCAALVSLLALSGCAHGHRPQEPVLNEALGTDWFVQSELKGAALDLHDSRATWSMRWSSRSEPTDGLTLWIDDFGDASRAAENTDSVLDLELNQRGVDPATAPSTTTDTGGFVCIKGDESRCERAYGVSSSGRYVLLLDYLGSPRKLSSLERVMDQLGAEVQAAD